MKIHLETHEKNLGVFESAVVPAKGDRIRVWFSGGDPDERLVVRVLEVTYNGDNCGGSRALAAPTETSVTLEVTTAL